MSDPGSAHGIVGWVGLGWVGYSLRMNQVMEFAAIKDKGMAVGLKSLIGSSFSFILLFESLPKLESST